MPLYEYECDKCHKVFEIIQKFSDTPLTVHDDCGGNLERLISAPALQFKGSGWYVTDYAGKSGNGSKKSESEPKSTTETKSESKPAETKSSGSETSTNKTD